MDTSVVREIKQFLDSNPRNRIIFHNRSIVIETVDVGDALSSKLLTVAKTRNVAIKAKEELDRILENYIFEHHELGPILSIENLGILFEPDFKFDFHSVIDKYSRNNTLLIKWDGEMDSNNIYFLTKANGIKINIAELNHTTI